jgi:hypothetical protein
MRCSTCRQQDAFMTWREKITSWFAWHLFPKTLKDEKSDSNTQGFVDGYSMGRGHERELMVQENLLKQFKNEDDIYKA